MSFKHIVRAQYQAKVDDAAKSTLRKLSVPKEGWLRTVRKALGMSGAELSRRAAITRARVSRIEKDELAGAVTLKNMEQMAEAMNCRFIYGVVPITSVEQTIEDRAKELASKIVSYTDTQMSLEAQDLRKQEIDSEIRRLTEEFKRNMPAKFWSAE